MIEATGVYIKGLYKGFPHKSVLENLNLDINPGSFVSIIGPSGCGKSTLLRLIADLDSPSSGRLSLTNTKDEAVSFVFQDANLLDWRNVFENVMLPFELAADLQHLSKKDREKRVHEALKKVQLADSQKLFPQELSGGMKMRVSLARALVNKPRLLLLDEPFAALDESTRFEMQDQLYQLWRTEKMTVIFVTHSLFEAAFLSERIIMLSKSQGRILLDQQTNLPIERDKKLRTSIELNRLVEQLSKRIQQ